MNDKFEVIPVPTKDDTGIILITKGVCAGGLVKKEYYGILNEDMGDTYVHFVGIGKNKILPGDTVINLKTKEIYAAGEGDVYPSYEKPIVFSTNSNLTYGKNTLYRIPTIHHSTYTGLIQQHNHSDGRSMWLNVSLEQPEAPERTDDIHLNSVLFNQWLEIKDEWFIKTVNGVVVLFEKQIEFTPSIQENNWDDRNEAAFNYVKFSKTKGDDARIVAGAFRAGIDFAEIKNNSYLNAVVNFIKNTHYNIKDEQVEMVKKAFEAGSNYYNETWKVNSIIKPSTGGEYNVVWKLDDGEYPVTSSMDWDAIKKVWTDPRCNDCERYDEVLYWKELPEPPKFIDEKIWKL